MDPHYGNSAGYYKTDNGSSAMNVDANQIPPNTSGYNPNFPQDPAYYGYMSPHLPPSPAVDPQNRSRNFSSNDILNQQIYRGNPASGHSAIYYPKKDDTFPSHTSAGHYSHPQLSITSVPSYSTKNHLISSPNAAHHSYTHARHPERGKMESPFARSLELTRVGPPHTLSSISPQNVDPVIITSRPNTAVHPVPAQKKYLSNPHHCQSFPTISTQSPNMYASHSSKQNFHPSYSKHNHSQGRIPPTLIKAEEPITLSGAFASQSKKGARPSPKDDCLAQFQSKFETATAPVPYAVAKQAEDPYFTRKLEESCACIQRVQNPYASGKLLIAPEESSAVDQSYAADEIEIRKQKNEMFHLGQQLTQNPYAQTFPVPNGGRRSSDFKESSIRHNKQLNSAVPCKDDSVLDLSVKTVRQVADSTEREPEIIELKSGSNTPTGSNSPNSTTGPTFHPRMFSVEARHFSPSPSTTMGAFAQLTKETVNLPSSNRHSSIKRNSASVQPCQTSAKYLKTEYREFIKTSQECNVPISPEAKSQGVLPGETVGRTIQSLSVVQGVEFSEQKQNYFRIDEGTSASKNMPPTVTNELKFISSQDGKIKECVPDNFSACHSDRICKEITKDFKSSQSCSKTLNSVQTAEGSSMTLEAESGFSSPPILDDSESLSKASVSISEKFRNAFDIPSASKGISELSSETNKKITEPVSISASHTEGELKSSDPPISQSDYSHCPTKAVQSITKISIGNDCLQSYTPTVSTEVISVESQEPDSTNEILMQSSQIKDGPDVKVEEDPSTKQPDPRPPEVEGLKSSSDTLENISSIANSSEVTVGEVGTSQSKENIDTVNDGAKSDSSNTLPEINFINEKFNTFDGLVDKLEMSHDASVDNILNPPVKVESLSENKTQVEVKKIGDENVSSGGPEKLKLSAVIESDVFDRLDESDKILTPETSTKIEETDASNSVKTELTNAPIHSNISLEAVSISSSQSKQFETLNQCKDILNMNSMEITRQAHSSLSTSEVANEGDAVKKEHPGANTMLEAKCQGGGLNSSEKEKTELNPLLNEKSTFNSFSPNIFKERLLQQVNQKLPLPASRNPDQSSLTQRNIADNSQRFKGLCVDGLREVSAVPHDNFLYSMHPQNLEPSYQNSKTNEIATVRNARVEKEISYLMRDKKIGFKSNIMKAEEPTLITDKHLENSLTEHDQNTLVPHQLTFSDQELIIEQRLNPNYVNRNVVLETSKEQSSVPHVLSQSSPYSSSVAHSHAKFQSQSPKNHYQVARSPSVANPEQYSVPSNYSSGSNSLEVNPHISRKAKLKKYTPTHSPSQQLPPLIPLENHYIEEVVAVPQHPYAQPFRENVSSPYAHMVASMKSSNSDHVSVSPKLQPTSFQHDPNKDKYVAYSNSANYDYSMKQTYQLGHSYPSVTKPGSAEKSLESCYAWSSDNRNKYIKESQSPSPYQASHLKYSTEQDYYKYVMKQGSYAAACNPEQYTKAIQKHPSAPTVKSIPHSSNYATNPYDYPPNRVPNDIDRSYLQLSNIPDQKSNLKRNFSFQEPQVKKELVRTQYSTPDLLPKSRTPVNLKNYGYGQTYNFSDVQRTNRDLECVPVPVAHSQNVRPRSLADNSKVSSQMHSTPHGDPMVPMNLSAQSPRNATSAYLRQGNYGTSSSSGLNLSTDRAIRASSHASYSNPSQLAASGIHPSTFSHYDQNYSDIPKGGAANQMYAAKSPVPLSAPSLYSKMSHMSEDPNKYLIRAASSPSTHINSRAPRATLTPKLPVTTTTQAFKYPLSSVSPHSYSRASFYEGSQVETHSSLNANSMPIAHLQSDYTQSSSSHKYGSMTNHSNISPSFRIKEEPIHSPKFAGHHTKMSAGNYVQHNKQIYSSQGSNRLPQNYYKPQHCSVPYSEPLIRHQSSYPAQLNSNVQKSNSPYQPNYNYPASAHPQYHSVQTPPSAHQSSYPGHCFQRNQTPPVPVEATHRKPSPLPSLQNSSAAPALHSPSPNSRQPPYEIMYQNKPHQSSAAPKAPNRVSNQPFLPMPSNLPSPNYTTAHSQGLQSGPFYSKTSSHSMNNSNMKVLHSGSSNAQSSLINKDHVVNNVKHSAHLTSKSATKISPNHTQPFSGHAVVLHNQTQRPFHPVQKMSRQAPRSLSPSSIVSRSDVTRTIKQERRYSSREEDAPKSFSGEFPVASEKNNLVRKNFSERTANKPTIEYNQGDSYESKPCVQSIDLNQTDDLDCKFDMFLSDLEKFGDSLVSKKSRVLGRRYNQKLQLQSAVDNNEIIEPDVYMDEEESESEREEPIKKFRGKFKSIKDKAVERVILTYASHSDESATELIPDEDESDYEEELIKEIEAKSKKSKKVPEPRKGVLKELKKSPRSSSKGSDITSANKRTKSSKQDGSRILHHPHSSDDLSWQSSSISSDEGSHSDSSRSSVKKFSDKAKMTRPRARRRRGRNPSSSNSEDEFVPIRKTRQKKKRRDDKEFDPASNKNRVKMRKRDVSSDKDSDDSVKKASKPSRRKFIKNRKVLSDSDEKFVPSKLTHIKALSRQTDINVRVPSEKSIQASRTRAELLEMKEKLQSIVDNDQLLLRYAQDSVLCKLRGILKEEEERDDVADMKKWRELVDGETKKLLEQFCDRKWRSSWKKPEFTCAEFRKGWQTEAKKYKSEIARVPKELILSPPHHVHQQCCNSEDSKKSLSPKKNKESSKNLSKQKGKTTAAKPVKGKEGIVRTSLTLSNEKALKVAARPEISNVMERFFERILGTSKEMDRKMPTFGPFTPPSRTPTGLTPTPSLSLFSDDSDRDSLTSFSRDHAASDSVPVRPRRASIASVLMKKLKQKYKEKKLDTHWLKKTRDILEPTNSLELLPTPCLSTDVKELNKVSPCNNEESLTKCRENAKDTSLNECSSSLVSLNVGTNIQGAFDVSAIRAVFGTDPPIFSSVSVEFPKEVSCKKESQRRGERTLALSPVPSILSRGSSTPVDFLLNDEDDSELRSERSVDSRLQDFPLSAIGKSKKRLRKMRKFRSGFDYIRKKKKVKPEDDLVTTPKKKIALRKRFVWPEENREVATEIRAWVINKGLGESILHKAARLQYHDVVIHCLESSEHNVNAKDNAGYTPLHEACNRGHLDIAQALCAHDAHLNAAGFGGMRPLHEAIENGHVELAHILLSYGADPSLLTYGGQSCLALAPDTRTETWLSSVLGDLKGKRMAEWHFNGPATLLDNEDGVDVLSGASETLSNQIRESKRKSEFGFGCENFDLLFESSDRTLPNVFSVAGREGRFFLLDDLLHDLSVSFAELVAGAGHLETLKLTTEEATSKVRSTIIGISLWGKDSPHISSTGHVTLVKETEKLRSLLQIELSVVASVQDQIEAAV